MPAFELADMASFNPATIPGPLQHARHPSHPHTYIYKHPKKQEKETREGTEKKQYTNIRIAGNCAFLFFLKK